MSGEVAEWSIALDLKSSVRKYRGFESHPLRILRSPEGNLLVDDPKVRQGIIESLD